MSSKVSPEYADEFSEKFTRFTDRPALEGRLQSKPEDFAVDHFVTGQNLPLDLFNLRFLFPFFSGRAFSGLFGLPHLI